MRTLKNICEAINTNFPDIKAFKTKAGITSIKWYCGNDACKEYLQSNLSGVVYTSVMPWFERNWNKMDNISMHIYKVHDSIEGIIYFNYGEIGGRAIKFIDQFESIKEAKTKMYEVLCKIRDDKDIFKKMRDVINSNINKEPLRYDEFMNL